MQQGTHRREHMRWAFAQAWHRMCVPTLRITTFFLLTFLLLLQTFVLSLMNGGSTQVARIPNLLIYTLRIHGVILPLGFGLGFVCILALPFWERILVLCFLVAIAWTLRLIAT